MTIKNFIKKMKLYSAETDKNTKEVAPGLFIERRRFLWLPVALAAVALVSPKRHLAGEKSNLTEGTMTWDEFIKECVPKSAELHKDATANGQNAYLYWIASMAARLNLETVPKARLGSFGGLNPPVEFGVGYRGVPFFVVEWRMAPNAFLPPHCHPNASVCTVGVEGEATLRNFEIVGDAPEFSSTEKFNVRQTHHELISNGRIATLSSKRDNIHTFQAGKDGARGIDISTYHDKDIGFSFLDIQNKPLDAEKRLFEAKWMKI